MRIIGLTLYLWLGFGARYAAAQEASQLSAPSIACSQFYQTALDQVSTGRLADAEAALSRALTSSADGLEPSCTGFLLHNMAVVMSLSGRLAEAESFAERSVKILEKSYPRENPALLRPLAFLSSALFEQRKIGKSRAVFQRILSIHIEQPEDRALVHTMAAALLQAETRYQEAESEYLRALAAWEEAGRGETAEVAKLLNMLGNLYIVDRRFEEAGRILARVLAIFVNTKEGLPRDRAKLLSSLAALHSQQGDWRKAEEDLRSAISTADREMQLDPQDLEILLVNYAYVLRKNHQRRDARTVEARAATLASRRRNDGVVDVSELFVRSKHAKK